MKTETKSECFIAPSSEEKTPDVEKQEISFSTTAREVGDARNEESRRPPNLLLGSKRDSGYGTDAFSSPATFSSPASVSSGRSIPRRFTYEKLDTDDDVSGDIEEMNIDEDEEVFEDEKDIQAGCISEEDDVDKEVESLTDSIESPHIKSQPIPIQRPQAPGPNPEDMEDEDDRGIVMRNVGDYSREYHMISSPYHHTDWTPKDRSRHRFRPIASRSCGTQTPSPHCQIIRQAIVQGRSGRPRLRLRIRTESEVADYKLPDVVPFPRDRSTSLPSVPTLRQVQEQEVGRELRRISDEFHSSFTPYRRTDSQRQASSLPTRVTFSFQATWTRIRRVFSNSALNQDGMEPVDHALSSH